jgi:peroxiredoxin
MKHILLLAVLVISQTIFAQEGAERGYKIKVGENAPAINIKYLDGTPLTNESLKGKVTVLQFTASWCSVCIKEMPHLEKDVWQRFKNEDFTLIGIDLKETPEKVKKFISKTGVTYPIALDTDGKLFESITVPNAGVTRNIVLDKNGKIIFLTRLFDKKEFEKMISVIEQELKS